MIVKAVSGENPLVFIIDELDRCRPSYAVELLEQVKHVFSVPGIIFVLAIDKVQLGHAVKGVYGSPGMDDVEYLRRFIDVEFSLPMPSPRYFIDYLFEYFNFNTFLLDENPRSSGNFFADTLKDFILTLSKIFNLQLRQIESLLKHLKIVFSSFRPVGGVNASIYILLAVLKLVHPEIYNRIKHRTFEEQDLINELSKLLPSNLNDKGWTIATLSYAYNEELNHWSFKTIPLIQINDDGKKCLILNYGKFNENGDYIIYMENLKGSREHNNLKTGRIIADIELSKKYFQKV